NTSNFDSNRLHNRIRATRTQTTSIK
ncbi:unnamed protein product, partial [Allacma fusca]